MARDFDERRKKEEETRRFPRKRFLRVSDSLSIEMESSSQLPSNDIELSNEIVEDS